MGADDLLPWTVIRLQM